MPLTKCFWIAGLSGAGKTTVSRIFVEMLRQRGQYAIRMDGDELRAALNENGYSAPARFSNGVRYAKLAAMLQNQGFPIVIAAGGMSPGLHTECKSILRLYTSVLLDVPATELERRDPKGIYLSSRQGTMRNVVGKDLMTAPKSEFDFIIDWNPTRTAEQSARELLNIWLQGQ